MRTRTLVILLFLVRQRRMDDLVAVLRHEGWLDAARDRLPIRSWRSLDLLRLIATESFVDGNLDQIGVGVTEVDRADRPDRPCS